MTIWRTYSQIGLALANLNVFLISYNLDLQKCQ